jgi:hypothetical protein
MTDFMIVEDFRTPTLSAAEIARRRNVSDTYAIYTFARYVDMDRLPLTEAISVDEVHLLCIEEVHCLLCILSFVNDARIDKVKEVHRCLDILYGNFLSFTISTSLRSIEILETW